jgi:U3 small nucleolar RNA-associated protein 20
MRQIITTALCAIGSSSPTLQAITEATRELNAFSTSHVDEPDFERMLPVLNALGAAGTAKGGWLDIAAENTEGPRTLFPLLYSCLHMLYSSDAVVGRSSHKALKSLITTCSEQIKSLQPDSCDVARNPWMQFIEKTVIPCLKTGLSTKADDSRRHFVLLFAHVARNFSHYKSPYLYGDLSLLIRDDDQDLDFFLNVTHLQLHRRVKALQRLRKMISAEGGSSLFSEQSYGNVLLPLAVHPVHENKSKSEDQFVVEAIATAGAIANHLPWGKYQTALQSVLNSLTRHPEKDRYLIALLCAIIDAFHFSVEVKGKDPEDKTATKGEGNGVSNYNQLSKCSCLRALLFSFLLGVALIIKQNHSES